jgi:[acyl-carrier-protein] S-malonyltransferase
MSRARQFAFLFPGQGSQYPGMGKDFVESFPIAKQTLEEVDDLLGRKLSSIILNGPEDVLTETRNSQTGIYASGFAILRVLLQNFPRLQPSVCAGLSLGEYTALAASGRIEFKDGLSLVKLRGQFMNDACESAKGTMAVILGLDSQAVEELVKEVNLPQDLWAANFNCPGQVVISGTIKGIEAGSEAAKNKGAKRVLPLQVYGAFHSGLMKSAEERLAEYIKQAPLKDSSIELVMNVPGSYVSNLDAIRSNLIKQVTHPVRWEQSIRQIDRKGIDCFFEIGCGKSLTGFNKRIGVKAPTISIEKVEDLELIDKELRSPL